MKDRFSERFPFYIPWIQRIWLQARKVYRQTTTRMQERAAARRPLDPLLDDAERLGPPLGTAIIPNPVEAINKCARWFEEDLARPDVKVIVDQLQALKGELASHDLRFTNTAGNFLRREYHPESEWGKLWEDAWLIRHAGISPGQLVLDVGGASTIFSFYLANIGCRVVVVDNDWANCGTIVNARHVAKRMGWQLKALDRDVQHPLPFPKDTFDRVFSVCVLEPLPPQMRQGLMAEIGRVLKLGGIAGFTTDYDTARPVLVTDKGLRFAYWSKLERDVIQPSGLTIYGPSSWLDACLEETFLGAFFLTKPLAASSKAFQTSQSR